MWWKGEQIYMKWSVACLRTNIFFWEGQVSKQGMWCICIFHSNVDRHCKYLINENEKWFVSFDGLVLWCLTTLSTIFQLYHPSFIGGGNRSTWRKPLYWQTLSHNVVSSTPCHEWVRTHNFILVIGTDCKGSCKSNYHTTTTPS